MVREKKLKIYFFGELSPKSKKRAIEDFRSNPDLTWDQTDTDTLTETFEQDLNDHYGLGEDMKANWSLGYCQGDGVCFHGWVDVRKFIETEKLEGKFGSLIDRIRVKIESESRYCHWNSMQVQVDDHARVEEFARPDDIKLDRDWTERRAEVMEQWRSDRQIAKEKTLAPIREWEIRKAEHQEVLQRWKRRRGEGPRAWLPGEPAPFTEPKPEPLPIPLPEKPADDPPAEVKSAQERVQNAWKRHEELVAEFEAYLDDRIKEISRELEKDGYATIEDHQTDDYIVDFMTGNEWEFLEDGKRWRESKS